MQKRVVPLLTLALALTLPGVSPAQSRQPPPKIHIDKVQVGFRAGQGSGFKAGSWTPVFIDLTCGDNPLGRADGDIIVQTNDRAALRATRKIPRPSGW